MTSLLRAPAVAALFIAAAAVVLLGVGELRSASAAEIDWVDHPSLVPEVPERGYPIIQFVNQVDARNRRPQSYAIDIVGNYLISGGNFQQIELQDGSIITQPYLSIVDWRTKQQVCTNLDVDDEVLSIAAGPRENTAYIGGRFDKVNGADGVERTRNKVALVDLETCEVDRTFAPTGANGKITDMTVVGNRLFVGGDFTSLGGVNQAMVAELNTTTGAVITAFNPTFTSVGLSSPIRGLGTDPAGTRLIVAGRFASVSDAFGNSVSGTVTTIMNITGATPVVTPHRFAYPHPEFGNRLWATSLQDADISPDGTKIGLAFGTATISDYAYLVPAVEAPTNATWQHYMRDSNFAIAVSNNAVYVAGHFCKIDSGPGATATMSPNSGPSTCTGSGIAGGAWRTQLAALSIADGTPLTWNPGNDAFRGGATLNVVSRGLLSGFDGDRTNNIRTGTTAFFDFGAPPDPREDQTCTATVNTDQSVTISWSDVDGVSNWSVRRDGTFLSNTTALTADDSPPKGNYFYEVRSRLDGMIWDTECSPNPVVVDDPPGADQTCTVVANNGEVTVQWTAIPGEDSYQVRRDDKWRASSSNLSWSESPGAGDYEYQIKSKMDGITTLTDCTPFPITVGDPAPIEQTCTATFNADGTVSIAWSAIDGENSYVVRKNGGYLAAAGNALSFVDSFGADGDSWVIRSRMGGILTDTACTNVGTPVQANCSLSIAGDQATLTWNAFNGENDNYVVRIAGSAVALVAFDDELTWTGAAVPGAEYLIRSREGGANTDLICN